MSAMKPIVCLLKRCFAFSGRMHGLFFVISLAAAFGLLVVGEFLICEYAVGVVSDVLIWSWGVALCILCFSFVIRRLHDVDRSGWWILAAAIPFVGWFFLLLFLIGEGTIGPNRFGNDDREGWEVRKWNDEHRYGEAFNYERELHACQCKQAGFALFCRPLAWYVGFLLAKMRRHHKLGDDETVKDCARRILRMGAGSVLCAYAALFLVVGLVLFVLILCK